MIYVDAACSGNGTPEGLTWWRGVNEQGEVVLEGGPISGTNNIGEFLAICDALRLSDKTEVYSDSQIAITWVRRGECKTKFELTPEVKQLIDAAVGWLKNNPSAHRVIKWDTRAYGEISADYGRK